VRRSGLGQPCRACSRPGTRRQAFPDRPCSRRRAKREHALSGTVFTARSSGPAAWPPRQARPCACPCPVRAVARQPATVTHGSGTPSCRSHGTQWRRAWCNVPQAASACSLVVQQGAGCFPPSLRPVRLGGCRATAAPCGDHANAAVHPRGKNLVGLVAAHERLRHLRHSATYVAFHSACFEEPCSTTLVLRRRANEPARLGNVARSQTVCPLKGQKAPCASRRTQGVVE